jgi:hypothetical protein
MKIRVEIYVDDVHVSTNTTTIHEDVSISPGQLSPVDWSSMVSKNPKKFEHSDEYVRNHDSKMSAKKQQRFTNGDILSGREIMVSDPKKRGRKPKEKPEHLAVPLVFHEPDKKPEKRGRKKIERLPDQALLVRKGELPTISLYDLSSPIDELTRGVQATSGRFIVKNTYFHDDINEVREKYRLYLKEMEVKYIKAEMGNKPGILSWEGFLVGIYSKQPK